MAYGRGIRQKDSRRIARYPITGDIRLLWTDESGNERLSKGQVLNVSRSGLQLRVDQKMPLRTSVICNDRTLNICGRGAVRYCNPLKGHFIVGLEFSGGTGWREPESVNSQPTSI